MIRQRRGPVLALAAAVVFAVLAIGSGSDRYSEFNPSLARLVPTPFRTYAARQLGLAALLRGDLTAAAEAATAAVANDPMNPRSVALLALLRGRQGDAAGADAAERVGALLGWREMTTQIYWFEQNFAAGEFEAAALRLDALLRARSDIDLLQTMLDKLERTPGGRRALSQRLRSQPAWAKAYLSAADSGDQALRARAAFLASDDAAIPAMGCEAIAPLIDALAARHLRRDAEALAQRHCPSLVRGGSLGDPDFADFISGKPNPFGWQRHGAGDLRVTPQDGGIEIANRASVSRLVVSQPIALDAGSYVLKGVVAGLEPDMLVATLDCKAPTRPGTVSGSIGGSGQILQAAGCENETLNLWLRPTGGALRLSKLSLRPAS